MQKNNLIVEREFNCRMMGEVSRQEERERQNESTGVNRARLGSNVS